MVIRSAFNVPIFICDVPVDEVPVSIFTLPAVPEEALPVSMLMEPVEVVPVPVFRLMPPLAPEPLFAVFMARAEEVVSADCMVSVPDEVLQVELPPAVKFIAPPEVIVIAPAAEFPREIVPVDVPPPIDVLKLEESLRDIAPPETVKPVLPVKRPADVMVPVEVVEIFPEVVMLSPALRGERVVVFLCQYCVRVVPPALMSPLQAKFPVAPSIVHPVFAEPPAMFTEAAVEPPGPILIVPAEPSVLTVVALVLKSESIPVAVVESV
jgi:hypothetical protein